MVTLYLRSPTDGDLFMADSLLRKATVDNMDQVQ